MIILELNVCLPSDVFRTAERSEGDFVLLEADCGSLRESNALFSGTAGVFADGRIVIIFELCLCGV